MTVLTYRNEATAWKSKNEAIREFKNEASRPRKPGERSELAEFKNEAKRPKFGNGPLSHKTPNRRRHTSDFSPGF